MLVHTVSSTFLFSWCSLRFFTSSLFQTKISQGTDSSICCLVQHPFKQCSTCSSLVVRHVFENGSVPPRLDMCLKMEKYTLGGMKIHHLQGKSAPDHLSWHYTGNWRQSLASAHFHTWLKQWDWCSWPCCVDKCLQAAVYIFSQHFTRSTFQTQGFSWLWPALTSVISMKTIFMLGKTQGNVFVMQNLLLSLQFAFQLPPARGQDSSSGKFPSTGSSSGATGIVLHLVLTLLTCSG